jgi:hypothetical protein
LIKSLPTDATPGATSSIEEGLKIDNKHNQCRQCQSWR